MATNDDKTQGELLHGPNLILDVENFGPIAEAQNIEFKPMTVFVGPSNSGKTYLAILRYAIAKGFNDANARFNSRRTKTDFENLSVLRAGLLGMPYVDSILQKLSPSHRGDDVIAYGWQNSSDEIQHIVNSMHSDWLTTVSNAISKSITEFFEIGEINELATQPSNPRSQPFFDLRPSNSNLEWKITYDNGILETDSALWPLFIRDNIAMRLVTDPSELDTDLNQLAMSQLRQAVRESFNTPFSKNLAHMTYFPASRSGIIASHRTLNRSLVASVFTSGSENEVVIRHNRIVNDFLENLLQLEPYGGYSDTCANQMAQILENALIDGAVVADPVEYGPPDLVYSQSDIRIPLTRSSSMVTELAPIILFLKHFIESGETLIIEEPEAHLHPAAQQKFAAALALLVRNGFRVLITTHSHYMVEQISDFVAASNLSPEKRRELLRLGPVLKDQDIYLNEDEVGVYGFDNSDGSTIVNNIPFDENFAYAPADHIQALTEQFNRNVGIMRAQRNGHSVNGHDAE